MTRFDSRRFWCLIAVALTVAGCGKSAENDAATAPASSAPTAAVASADKSNNTTVAASTQPVEEGDPIVVMHTSLGSIYVRLYQRQAPRTVANFLDYARTNHYSGTVFHQVEPGYVAICGAFDEQLKAKPVRYPVVNEAQNGLKNIRGSLAMARDPGDANSATSMFFINLADNPKLDHQGASPEQYGFCVFGQVIDGLDVLDQLSAAKTGKVDGFTSMPTPRIVLNTIKGMRAARDPQVQPAGYNNSNAAAPKPKVVQESRYGESSNGAAIQR